MSAGATTSGFVFETVPRIVCADGAAATLGRHARELGMSRALVVTDRALLGSGVLDEAIASLPTARVDVVSFADVVADPPESCVLAAVERARGERVDGVIGLGGGSSMDVAKLAALLVRSGESLDAVYGVARARGPRLPLLQVPTTAGTGSEVTAIAIVTTPTGEKQGVVSGVLYADLALLDATLTLGLPAATTAMTGIDAMVHAIEAYTSRHRRNVLSDSLATRALSLLSDAMPRVLAEPSDLDARRAMLQGATLAGMAFANAPVAAVHALAYPLGGHYGVPHGLSNALVLGPVLRFNLPDAAARYGELAAALRRDGAPACPRHSGEAFVEAMEGIVAGLGLPRTLRDVGVTEDALPLLATDAMKVTRLLVNNPRDVTWDDALALYRQAWQGTA